MDDFTDPGWADHTLTGLCPACGPTCTCWTDPTPTTPEATMRVIVRLELDIDPKAWARVHGPTPGHAVPEQVREHVRRTVTDDLGARGILVGPDSPDDDAPVTTNTFTPAPTSARAAIARSRS